MVLYLLHSDIRLGRPGRYGAQHYLGWSTPKELRYRIAEHQHGTAKCAITAAYHRVGATLQLVYVRWTGGPAEEKYLKANGHLTEFCPICRPGIARYARSDEWYLLPGGQKTPSEPSPKPGRESGGDSSPGNRTGRRGWSPRGRYQESITGSAWRKADPSDTGGTASRAPAQQQPKEDT